MLTISTIDEPFVEIGLVESLHFVQG
jgi:hypothetical protein